MKKKSGLSAKILMMISLTSIIICIFVTAAGGAMIYITTENGMKTEIECAARALYNLYEYNYRGEYYVMDDTFYKGEKLLTAEDFEENIKSLRYSSDIDFSLFWGDVRTFTSVRNNDGTLAVGTRSVSEVSNTVINEGREYYSNKVAVNGNKYLGYYIPIKNNDGLIVGMVFAGMPAAQAEKNMKMTIGMFVLISIGVLVISMAICSRFSAKLVDALLDIKDYMENVADCNFEKKLKERTSNRPDEVGDIARSAKKLKGNLRDLIERDPLTSLLNRRSCRMIIDEITDEKKKYCIAMGDIDFFKKVNDTFGHACGDMVLKEISAILGEEAGKANANVSRWGGEEFLIVFSGMNMTEVYSVLESIMLRVRSNEFMWDGKRVPVTMTIGAVESEEGESADDTINRADKLLYEGKNTGRNKIVT